MRDRSDVLHKRKSNQKNGSPNRCKSGSSSYASASELSRGERPSFSTKNFYNMRDSKNKSQWAVAEVKVSYKPKKEPVQIKTSDDAYNVFQTMWDQNLISIQEQVGVLFLNQHNQVIGYRCLHTGGITASVLDLKILFSMCCKVLAQGIILCHNHPSGNPRASEADREITRNVKTIAKLLDIALIDHLIITPNGYTTV